MEDFERRLQAALIQRDKDAMRTLMGDDFILALTAAEGFAPSTEQLPLKY